MFQGKRGIDRHSDGQTGDREDIPVCQPAYSSDKIKHLKIYNYYYLCEHYRGFSCDIFCIFTSKHSTVAAIHLLWNILEIKKKYLHIITHMTTSMC